MRIRHYWDFDFAQCIAQEQSARLNTMPAAIMAGENFVPASNHLLRSFSGSRASQALHFFAAFLFVVENGHVDIGLGPLIPHVGRILFGFE